jgi:hypothetical protein
MISSECKRLVEWSKKSCGLPRWVEGFIGECAAFPAEWVERGYNLQHWSTMSKGGHFAAMEQPELLAADIREFFRPHRR